MTSTVSLSGFSRILEGVAVAGRFQIEQAVLDTRPWFATRPD